MKEFDIKDKYKNKTVLCLGFFDSLHRGHQKILDTARQASAKIGAEAFVFTFRNNFFKTLGKEEKLVFTYAERKLRLAELGFENIVSAEADREFLSFSGAQFAALIKQNFDVAAVVCGTDYKFGKKAEENAESLKKYFGNVIIVDLQMSDGKKIASGTVRELISEGRVQEVNSLLGLPYFISGRVTNGRRDGQRIGFPTANLDIPEEKIKPGGGVYLSRTVIDGTKHFSISNIGAHPTFDDFNYNVETFIFDYEGNIYGKNIKVEFLEKIRDVVRFGSAEELGRQIRTDCAYAKMRSSFYD